MARKLVLQIYENDVPLTLVEVARIIHGLKDKDIRETANSTWNNDDIPRFCRNKLHTHYRSCVGGGICIAKKYKRMFSFIDQVCVSCESTVITDTLNYMFKTYYDGRYRAEWRKTRKTRRSKPDREDKAAKTRGEKKKQEQIAALNGMTSEPPKKKGRPKKSKPAKAKPKEKKKPKTEKKLAVAKPRQKKIQGRPRNRKVRQAEAA